MIYIVGTFTAFFLALTILTKKGRTTADFILGIWMMIVGIHVFSYYGFIDQFIYDYPIFLGINFPLPFLHGPLLYLYTLALTRPLRPFWPSGPLDGIHLHLCQRSPDGMAFGG